MPSLMSCRSEKQRFTDIFSANLSFCGKKGLDWAPYGHHHECVSVKSSTLPPKLSHYSLITAFFSFSAHLCLLESVWSYQHVTVYDTRVKYRLRWLMFVIAAWFLFRSVYSELIKGKPYCSRSGEEEKNTVLAKWNLFSITEHHIKWGGGGLSMTPLSWKFSGTGNRWGRKQEMNWVIHWLWCSSWTI